MNDCKYCSKSGNCLLHVGCKWHQKFLSPCIGKECGSYKRKEERAQYKRGAKAYLASFAVGEMREWDGSFPWRSLSSIAARLKRDYGCAYRLTTIAQTNKKVIIRLV